MPAEVWTSLHQPYDEDEYKSIHCWNAINGCTQEFNTVQECINDIIAEAHYWQREKLIENGSGYEVLETILYHDDSFPQQEENLDPPCQEADSCEDSIPF